MRATLPSHGLGTLFAVLAASGFHEPIVPWVSRRPPAPPAIVGFARGPAALARGSLAQASQPAEALDLPSPPLRQPSPAFVTIGDGFHSTGDFVGEDESPFVAALEALPSGGTIVVGAGTYRFTTYVSVATAGIEIRGAGASIRSSAHPVTGAFLVTAPRVTFDGLEFRDATPFLSHSVLEVLGSEFRLRNARFDGGAAVAYPTFVYLHGPAEERWIEDVVFAPDRGWTCVRADDGVGLHLVANEILGAAGNPALLEYGFIGVNETRGEIRGNVFQDLGTGAAPARALVHLLSTQGEKHHFVIAGNTIHTVAAERVFHLSGARFDVVTGNSIGKIDEAIAMVEIDPSPSGGAPGSTTITGNDFHNASVGAMVRINGGSGYHLASNHFTVASGTAVLVGDFLAASRVAISANQFSAGGVPVTTPAISIQGGQGHGILSNVFHGFSAPAVAVTGVAATDYSVQANFED